MNKHFLCFMLMLLTFGSSYGQKLHAFLFCKTSDKTVGVSAGINFVSMRDRLQQISEALNIEYKEYPVTGSAFKINRITSELANADFGATDIVIMYFSTHGVKTTKDQTVFPNLDIPDSLISAYAKHQVLLKRKPKILMTIIEACSGFVQLSSQQAFLFEQSIVNMRNEPLNQRQINNVRTLFAKPFKLIITAGEAGKNTYATSQGSIFTSCFLDAMNEYIDLPTFRVLDELNWNNILEQTKTYTENRTSNFPITYQPVWETTEYHGLIEQGILNFKPAETRDVRFVVKTRKKKIPIGNPYIVELTIDNKTAIPIDSVVYYLHETMPKPVIKVTESGRNYIHTFSVWGKFPLKAKVYFNDGKNFEYFKDFNFVETK